MSRDAALVLLATVASFVPVLRGGHAFVADDVFFYLEIAGHVVRGLGITFNQVTPTNGFHPLWLLLCVATRAVVGPDRALLVLAIFGVSLALTAAALLLFLRLARALGLRCGVLGAALLASFVARNPIGSEFCLALLLLLVACSRVARHLAGDRRPAVLLSAGLALGLASLARLDLVFVAGALGVAATLRPAARPPQRLAAALRVGIPAALIVAPYLAWNVASFGHPVPISGLVKAGWARPGLSHLGDQALVLQGLALAGCAATLRARGPTATLLRALTGGALLHGAYTALRMAEVWPWYYVGELVAAALALTVLAERLPRGRWLAPGVRAAAVAPLVAVTVANHHTLGHPPLAWYRDVARAVDELVPPGEGVVTAIPPGAVAYFSDRPVFALDGLTGDLDYQFRAADEGVEAYFTRRGLRYLIAPGPVSADLPELFRRSQAEPYGVWNTKFFGHAVAGGSGRVTRVEVLSSLSGRSLGTISLAPERLIASFADPPMGIWRIGAE